MPQKQKLEDSSFLNKESDRMANLIVITGPQAVGKMTVAEALKDKIDYKLMINHDSIELAIKIFGNKTNAQKEYNEIVRKEAFNVAVKNNIDMIFTYVTAFDIEEDKGYLQNLKNMFEATGGTFSIVELKADLETRIERNITPHRLEMKPSKKNLNWSKNEIMETMQEHRLNSNDDEFLCENHIKIDNTNLSPEEVADIIIEQLNLSAKTRKKK